jgi:hypothetical protein
MLSFVTKKALRHTWLFCVLPSYITVDLEYCYKTSGNIFPMTRAMQKYCKWAYFAQQITSVVQVSSSAQETLPNLVRESICIILYLLENKMRFFPHIWCLNMWGCLKFMYPVPKWTSPNWIALNQTTSNHAKACIARAVASWQLYIPITHYRRCNCIPTKQCAQTYLHQYSKKL